MDIEKEDLQGKYIKNLNLINFALWSGRYDWGAAESFDIFFGSIVGFFVHCFNVNPIQDGGWG